MTTIAAIQGDNYVVVGADTRISSYDSAGSPYQISTLGNGQSKISLNKKYLLGAAGDVRAINILHHVFQPPAVQANLRGKKLDQFITSKFIPALRVCFEQQGYSMPDEKSGKEQAQQGSSIVVVVNATIYVIENDYSWTSEAGGLYAVGSGSSYALGALHALTYGKKLSPAQARRLVLKSLQIAAKYDSSTGSPFHAYTQEVKVSGK